MKKLISIIMILGLVLTMVSGLAEDTFLGEWYTSYYGLPVTLILNADGTASMLMPGMDEAGSASWTLDGDHFTLTMTDSGNTSNGSLVNDGILLPEADGDNDFFFTREPVAPIQIADVNPEAVMEDFNGQWEAAYVDIGGSVIDASATGEDGLPGVIITDGVLTFADGADSMSVLFGVDPITMTFENGTLAYSKEFNNDDISMALLIKAEMLQDGMLALTVDMGTGVMTLYEMLQSPIS